MGLEIDGTHIVFLIVGIMIPVVGYGIYKMGEERGSKKKVKKSG